MRSAEVSDVIKKRRGKKTSRTAFVDVVGLSELADVLVGPPRRDVLLLTSLVAVGVFGLLPWADSLDPGLRHRPEWSLLEDMHHVQYRSRDGHCVIDAESTFDDPFSRFLTDEMVQLLHGCRGTLAME